MMPAIMVGIFLCARIVNFPYQLSRNNDTE